jgi:hypothetical protein
MTFQEIKQAIADGKKVYWMNLGYEVIKDSLGEYLVICLHNNNCVGLTSRDGTKVNGKEKDFFIG